MKIFIKSGVNKRGKISLPLIFLLPFFLFFSAYPQNFERELQKAGIYEAKNPNGRIWVIAEPGEKASISADGGKESDLSISGAKVSVSSSDKKKRIDLILRVPERSEVKIETQDSEVKISGNLKSASVKTETGTIYTEIPLYDLTYNFLWVASRPRYMSDIELEKVKEGRAGRFLLQGKYQKENEVIATAPEEGESIKEPPKSILLNFTTGRGIILLNVKPSEVSSDLRERPLTEASRAIVRSGDSMLMAAIRKASPKYFGDYAKTLPPLKREPLLTISEKKEEIVNSPVKQVNVKVIDEKNRAVAGLAAGDFEFTEGGKPREIIEVKESKAQFNLVLLLDVSGSIENYVDFIRKTARQFVNTMDKNDRISIITFSDDVKIVSRFTTDREGLSKSLDSFDAGGGTAFYDAVAFSIVETLRPLRGERTAIVAITDGDDNRSFLPFDALMGSIEESGALIYPLYVPSELIASSAASSSPDSLRTKYLGLTSKAQGEGEKLAKISGGVYYPIKRLDDLQKAYDDISIQLRTSYTITFRSETIERGGVSPRLKVKVNRANVYTKLGPVEAGSSKDLPEKQEIADPE